MMFALFTDIPMDEVREMIKTDIVKCKKRLSFEITKFIRGEEDAIQAQQMSENLFTHGGDDAPEFVIAKEEFADGKNICDLLVMTKLCSSKSEARRMIEGGGVTAGGNKVVNFAQVITLTDLDNNSILLKRGKKNFIKVVVK